MLAPGQLFILTEMGIPVWEFRPHEISNLSETNAIESSASEVVQTLPNVDYLMVVAEQDNTAEAQRLLQAMLFSIGLTARNSAVVSPKQLNQLLTGSNQHKVLFAFGDGLIPLALTPQATDRGQIYSTSDSALKIIISLPLNFLLESPQKKALAWQDLQLVKTASLS